MSSKDITEPSASLKKRRISLSLNRRFDETSNEEIKALKKPQVAKNTEVSTSIEKSVGSVTRVQ